MVDVSAKQPTVREAEARAFRRHEPRGPRVRCRNNPKGDPLEVARIAGIHGREAHVRPDPDVPSHPAEQGRRASRDVQRDGVAIRTLVRTTAVTGVEMEALVAASVAALTVYDMCKALDKGIAIREVALLRKSGGKSGDYQRRSRRRARPSDEPSRTAPSLPSATPAPAASARTAPGPQLPNSLRKRGFDVTA